MNLIVGRKHTQTKKIPPQYTEERHNLYVNGGCQSVGQTIMANCGKKKYSLPSKQIFLSCMAFSVYEIVRLACQSRSWFVLYAQGPIAKIEFSNSYTSSFVSTVIHYPKRIGGGGGSDIT